ncbi:elongation factor P [Wolbachia endosymbiont of Atemnus politus]|uniref:elongation factor P n=1 Tax=Wolbachia endosymbiont of Atemnus politus TaxID=2682840 RepID=UPI00157296CD|nr:elongation factor P [Wolbachia endosymbiont of Atemnus politus]NSM56343.1 elongation factor P [Wolbachia endosymbiont of Atemnus politus]NSX83047.1 elongation factor P [Wolbachia endosymbiont of Atemnus politus]
MAERANDIRPGQVLEHNGGLFLVVSIMHTQPGKGGAYVQVEMKNIKTGAKHYERFRSDATIRRAILDEEEYVYLFTEEDIVHLMHPSNYEQIIINLDLLGKKKIYLQDNMKVKVVSYQDKIISAHVPDYVTLTVKETESVIKGQTVTSSYKPAILENGMRVNMPQFIKEEDKIVVYTPDDSYYERVKE